MMKKFVLFIVEGRNDEREIQAILRTPYFQGFMEKYIPQFKALGRDITLDAPGKISIKNVVGKVVRDWKNGDTAPFNPIKNPMIKEIIHIVDMDGAGVPESAIIQDNVGGFIYEDEIIRAAKIGQATQRNGIKKKNLIELVGMPQIENLPYRIFYVSCNMDHVLSGQRNPNTKYKDTYSFQYGNICKANPEIIYKSIFSDDIGTSLSYADSWKEIMQGTNSLKRKTNLNLLLQEYMEIK